MAHALFNYLRDAVYTAGGTMDHARGKTDTKAAWVCDCESSHSHFLNVAIQLVKSRQSFDEEG